MRTYFVLVKMTTLKTSLEKLYAPDYQMILLINANKEPLLTSEQRSVFADIQALADFSFDSLAQAVNRSRASEIRFVTNDESCLQLVGQLRDHFQTGEPSFENVNRFKDKGVMKKALVTGDSSLKIPRYLLVDPAEYSQSATAYLEKIESQLSYPLFAKPVDSAASCFTQIVPNRNELCTWLKEFGTKENFELDEYLSGDLYHCDSLVKDGEILFSRVSKYLAPCADFMEDVPLASMPLLEDSAEATELSQYNKQVLSALSPVPNGAFHLEVFKTAAGDLIFLEIAARTPGAYVPQVFQRAFGISLEEAHLALQMGIDHGELCKPTQNLSAAFFWYPRQSGVVTELFDPKIASSFEMDWKVKVGDQLSAATELGDFSLGIKIWGEYSEVQREFARLSSFQPLRLAHAEIK